MSTGRVDVSYQVFDECRGRVRETAKAFVLAEIIKETKSVDPGAVTHPALFGTLARAQELTTKMQNIWSGIGGEIESGRTKLDLVERALDEVETNLRAAETDSGA
ncbi:hypothetical protein FAF44_04880 [Nonomuraea sp. MG754425]|uniref:hypothetical protein n=1 Tax=Nonomuraea sp. MG754425 TaxID=2570319 RepID=UPI001F342D15|nr:hypothetical protein [Nonomuraea sp. MG754425]MCF6467745.1 hypothetical protein [Nonomuraea sp. MG754425]